MFFAQNSDFQIVFYEEKRLLQILKMSPYLYLVVHRREIFAETEHHQVLYMNRKCVTQTTESVFQRLKTRIKNLVVFMFAKYFSSIYDQLKIRKFLNSDKTYFPCKKRTIWPNSTQERAQESIFLVENFLIFFSTFFMKCAFKNLLQFHKICSHTLILFRNHITQQAFSEGH